MSAVICTVGITWLGITQGREYEQRTLKYELCTTFYIIQVVSAIAKYYIVTISLAPLCTIFTYSCLNIRLEVRTLFRANINPYS